MSLITFTLHSGNQAALYLNDTLANSGTLTNSLNTTASAVYIGKATHAAQWYKGRLTLPMIYNRALSAEEIEARYLIDRHLFGEAWYVTFGAEETEVQIGASAIAFIVFGTVQTSSTYETGLDSITVTNTGSCNITITIKGTDMTGGVAWTLSDICEIGKDIFGLKAGLEGGDYTIIVKKSTPYNTLVADLAVGASQKFGVKFYAPSTFTDGVTKKGTITLTATIT